MLVMDLLAGPLDEQNKNSGQPGDGSNSDLDSLFYQPISPPDSSQGWSGCSSGSDDDHSPIAMEVDPPSAALSGMGSAKRQRVSAEAMVPPAPSLLKFPTWNSNSSEYFPALVQPKVEPSSPPPSAPPTPSVASIEKVAAAIRADCTPSPTNISLTGTTKAPKTAAPAKKTKSIPPLKSHTSGRSGGAANARKKVNDTAESQRKRTLHNAIERRYRNSINEKINELKKKLPLEFVDDEKMNKSSIIQKGIDYIIHLEEENRRLKANASGSDLDPKNDESVPVPLPIIDTSSQTTRVLLCVLACGLFALGPGTGSVQSIQSASEDIHSRAGSRVLAGFDQDEEDAGWPVVQAMVQFFLFYAFRAIAAAAMVFVIFKQDVVTDPRDAAQQHARCSNALRERNIPKAKHYATRAQSLLGASLPTSHWGLFTGLACQSIRQLLHRCFVGQWIDVALARSKDSVLATWVAASVDHELHQMMLRLGEPTEWTHLSRMFLTLRSLNAAESIPTKVDPATMIQVYLSSAVQMEMIFQTDLASIMSDYFLRQARHIYHKHPEVVPALSWLFKPSGNSFFRSGSWCSKTVAGVDGEILHPGCFEQLTATFHLDLLGQGLLEIAAGQNTDRVHDLFADLRESAHVCGDPSKKWWGIMGLVHVSWRRGRKAVARQYLCELESAEFAPLTPTQSFVYAASRAHQALLDGDHKLCWQACELGSSLCDQAELLSSEGVDDLAPLTTSEYTPANSCYSSQLRQLALLLGFRQLLSTRVALIRLRIYLGSAATSGNLQIPEFTVDSDDGAESRVTRAAMLTALQQDLCGLRRLSDSLPMARSTVFQYQAIHRSLAGGRVALTERIFHKGLKVAKEQALPFEEASLLLQCAVYLRQSLSKDLLQSYLSRASTIFEHLQAAEELCTSRKLLQLAMYS